MSSAPKFKRYLCSYRYDGDEWSIEIPARDRIEALRRMLAIGFSGEVKGEFVLKLKVPGLTWPLFGVGLLSTFVAGVAIGQMLAGVP